MSLNLEQKQAVVAGVAKVLADAQSTIVAEYRGLTVAQMTRLRSEARKGGIHVRVIKNTLARRAMQGTPFECLTDRLSGPLAYVIGKDPAALAKLTTEFAKANDKFRITAGVMDGKLMSEAEMKALATLPSREVLLAMVLGTMKAPVQKFVQTLNEIPTGFVRVLAAVRDQKQATAS